MINEKKKKGNLIFSEEKEVSILKHYNSPKSSKSISETSFLYSDPSEVILQSKLRNYNQNTIYLK